MHPNLSFEQAPPFSVPVRFFLVAPWFGVLAGVLLAVVGGDVLPSRWSAPALALTHLFAAGFMLQAMTGALLQFVPVAAGGNVWRPLWLAALVQPLLGGGALLLVAGFARSRPDVLRDAAIFLLAGLTGLALALMAALWRTPARGATLVALRLAVAGLVVTGILGFVLAAGMARGWPLPFSALTDVHLAWGLGAWALMLLIGVSYYVVPMFQLTPPYPAWAMRHLGPLLFLLVLFWSAVHLLDVPDPWRRMAAAATMLTVALFAFLTLQVQARRRRRLVDASFLLFRLAMTCLLAFAGLGLAMLHVPSLGEDGRAAATLGVLAFVGVFTSAITGMLYKIVPFIAWLHLQRLGAPMRALPNMQNIISGTQMIMQMRLHALSVGLLLAVPWMPGLAVLAGLLSAAAFAWLGGNLIGGVRRYRMFRDRIRANGAGREL